MQIKSIQNQNFGARWSSSLAKKVKGMRAKQPELFEDIKNLQKGSTIELKQGWYQLRDKTGEKILMFPAYFDHVRNRFFGPDVFVVRDIRDHLVNPHQKKPF